MNHIYTIFGYNSGCVKKICKVINIRSLVMTLVLLIDNQNLYITYFFVPNFTLSPNCKRVTNLEVSIRRVFESHRKQLPGYLGTL